MENLIENLLLCAAAMFFLWGFALLGVAFTARDSGFQDNEDEVAIRKGGE